MAVVVSGGADDPRIVLPVVRRSEGCVMDVVRGPQRPVLISKPTISRIQLAGS